MGWGTSLSDALCVGLAVLLSVGAFLLLLIAALILSIVSCVTAVLLSPFALIWWFAAGRPDLRKPAVPA